MIGRSASAGFTLIEVVVSIAVVSVVATMIATAYPVVRQAQQLDAAEQQIQAALYEARDMAFNEERDQKCLDQADVEKGMLAKYCSDVGVKFDRDKLILFADSDNSETFAVGSDFIIKTIALTGGVYIEVPTPDTEIFYGEPPSLRMEPGVGPEFKIVAATSTRAIFVDSLGRVERKDR